MRNLTAIFFNPLVAIARIGSGDTPVEAFEWADDPTVHGALQTVIRPAVTLEVTPDDAVLPYLPTLVHFKDARGIRPTAPFLELWGVFDNPDGPPTEEPLTLDTLASVGATPGDIAYAVTAANLKAARRTQDVHCGFVAYAAFNADDYGDHALLACSHAAPDAQPLVFAEHPIPLGSVHVIRPVSGVEMGVDLGAVRLRFMPAKGYVYGPPDAVSGAAPRTLRVHEIVPPERRILNPNATWSAAYNASYARYDNPEPSDTYDGADADEDPASRSWGVVDDTCDATIEAFVVLRGRRLQARARVTSGPPDFAPDRRPFVSLADDLTQRTRPEPEPVDEGTVDDAFAEVADIFTRIFEVVSLMNVDYTRDRAIISNTGSPSDGEPPYTDKRTMTSDDRPYADQAPAAVQGLGPDDLPYSEVARAVHVDLSNADLLAGWLRSPLNRKRMRLMMRPPFAFFAELDTVPLAQPPPPPPPAVTRGGEKLRDPRVAWDLLHDMRMPPYMRDELAAALSLTHRQYRKVTQYLDYLDALQAKPPGAAGGLPASRIEGELQRFVAGRSETRS